MTVPVEFVTVDARATAVVAQTTSWAEFPRLWGQLLDEVYRFVRGRTELAGPCWEIYGHWREDPRELETEIYWLLR